MQPSIQRIVIPSLRWGWLILLLAAVFAYFTAGLSRPVVSSAPLASRLSAKQLPHQTQAAAGNLSAVDDELHEPGGHENASVRQISLQPRPAGPLRPSRLQLDQVWAETIEQRELQPAPMADWMTVCRRVSLALVGTGMSLEEIRLLQQHPPSARPQIHLESLLNDARFHDYWAERWTRFLVGTDDGPFLVYRRRRFRLWLSDVFAENWRYDRLVRNLVTAEGLWTDQPEVNFMTSTYDSGDEEPDPIRLAARTSRVFLGLRIDCLQCHDDFLGNVSLGSADDPHGGRQSDFHQLAAFFSSAKANGLQGVLSGQVDYHYKYLDAEDEVSVEPAVPYSPELMPKQGDARRRLAIWITHPQNRQAARAAVSHVWALLFGKPVGDSVDNLPLDLPAPPMLEYLADDFVDNGFDVRRLIRLIVRSKAFRVGSRADFDVTTEHEQAHAVFPLVRLRPEQVAGAAIQSARIKRIDRDSAFFVQLQKFGGTNDFVKRYGDMGEDEFSGDSVTISQRLVMLNGKLIEEVVEANPILNASSHINLFAGDTQQAVETVYLCVLNRYPSPAERQHFVRRLDQPDRRVGAIEDLTWVLLNSTEFAWNH